MVATSGADNLDEPYPDTDKYTGVLVVTKESSTSDNYVGVYDDNAIKVQQFIVQWISE